MPTRRKLKKQKLEELELEQNRQKKWVLYHADVYHFEEFYPVSEPMDYDKAVEELEEHNKRAKRGFDAYEICPVDDTFEIRPADAVGKKFLK